MDSPKIREKGFDDVAIVVNTSIDEKKNTFNFADGTATQAFELPNQARVSALCIQCSVSTARHEN